MRDGGFYMTRYIAALCVAAALLALCGCAGPQLTDRDAAALEQLAAVAGPTSGVDAAVVESTECWLPSEHPLTEGVDSESAWKVLCRIHYSDDTGPRYQDTTCIGDFERDPMLDHCYRWTHYDFADAFEDHPSVSDH